MAITYPLDVPLEQFSNMTIEMVDVNAIQTATFTGQDSVQEFEGDYWRIRLTYTDLDRNLAQPIKRFIAALRGSVGTFVVGYPGYSQPLGEAKNNPSSPLVDGQSLAGQRILPIKNGPISVANWLVEGDIIQVGPDSAPHWHMILNDVDTSGTGTASADVWPALRNTVANNQQIVTENPRSLFRLISVPEIALRSPVIHSMTLEAREVTGT